MKKLLILGMLLAVSLSAQCTTGANGWCNTGLSTAQNSLLGPLIPYGASPWVYGDLAEKGTADNMAPAALAETPTLGAALSGTVSFSGSGSTVTTTADLRTPLSGQGYVTFAWNTVDGAGTGRQICAIISVTVNSIVCESNIFTGAFSGITAYLMPGADSHGWTFLAWTQTNPIVTWNYYDVGIALYRLYYRTLNATYLTQARAYADIQWQWVIDHGYTYPYPRAASMISQFFRAGEGHSERFPGLYTEVTKLVQLFGDPSNSPAIDNREAGYTLWDVALGAKTDTDPTRHAQYCSWLTTYVPTWNAKQSADGSWGQAEYMLNPSFVSAPKSFTAPFIYGASPWREAINIKAMEAAYESLNDTTTQGCNSTTLAASTLTAITTAVQWQNNYGRDTSNRGVYYEVNSQSNEQATVYPGAGTVSITNGSTSLVGIGTDFLTQCTANPFIGLNSTRTIYKFSSCSDNTHAVLTQAYGLYGEVGNLSGSAVAYAPSAVSVCNSSATYCYDGVGDRNLTRTVCGGIAWLYSVTLNATYKTWTDECISAQLGGPTAGLTSAAVIGFKTLPCSGSACDGLVTDTIAAAADCNTQAQPCAHGVFLYGNLGKNYGEAFGAPGIDNALAWRLLSTPTCSPKTGTTPPNVTDIQLQTNMALGTVACTNSLTQTGTCTVVDVQRVVNAALGQACVIGPTPATSDDEFVGPFPSWTNLVTSYGTSNAAIQTALNDLGTAGHSHVLYVPCGTYTITTTLTISSKEGISVLGADPTCVTFQLSGVGPLLHVNGVNYSKFDRITFDGGGNPSAILVQQSNNSGAFFDTGNEYTDDVFRNAWTGIQCGWLVNGCSEVSILRDQFSNITGAGVFVGNYNALDIWVRYSVFDHCNIAVGNYDGTNVGAGNFHAYNSIFRSSTISDINIGNTLPFSFRDNYFTSSPYALRMGGTANPAPMTIASNTFVNQTVKVIQDDNQGPVLLLDNATLQANMTLPTAIISQDGIAVGNQFTLGPSPISASVRLFESGTQIVGSIPTTEPTLPGFQPNLNRMVFEVAAGSSASVIQTAINSAVALNGSRPVVHLPEGTYSINVPLSIPANSDLQLTGDGFFATTLNWIGAAGTGPVILIGGPSHATLRDFRVNAALQADGIGAYGIDQSGSRVFIHGSQMAADNLAANANLFYDGLDNAVLDIEDTSHTATAGTGVNVTGGPLASIGTSVPGMVRFFSTSGGDETLPYSVSGGGTLLVRDDWSETSGPAFANISGRALVTFDGVHAFLSGNTGQATPGIAISNLIGKVSILTSNPQDRTVISGNGTNSQVMQAGGDQDCTVINPYFIDNTSPAGVSGLLIHRECTTTVPGTGSIATANAGNNGTTFVTSMLAQTRAAHQVPLTTLSNSVTDLRMYRVWTNRGTNGIHLTTVRANLH